jgi:hypothetical protein
MDELALLKDFRLEDASNDGAREHARAALQAAMTRRRLPRRRYALVLAFVLAAVLAAAAYAIVHEFVIGSPAPKDVSQEVAYIVGRTIPKSVVQGHVRQELAGKPRVAALAQTEWGPMYLIVAPLLGGGGCRFRLLPSNQSHGVVAELLAGGAECTTPAHPPTLSSSVTTVSTAGRPTLQLVEGYAPRAVRVRIGHIDYATPLGWFLAEYHGPEQLIAYDSRGRIVGRSTAGRE